MREKSLPDLVGVVQDTVLVKIPALTLSRMQQAFCNFSTQLLLHSFQKMIRHDAAGRRGVDLMAPGAEVTSAGIGNVTALEGLGFASLSAADRQRLQCLLICSWNCPMRLGPR